MSEINIEPLNEHYLIEVEKPETIKSLEKHGIKIDKNSTPPGNIGKVIQVHSHNGSTVIHPGDTVVFKIYGNDEVNVGDKEYLFVPESNIIGRIIINKE